MAHASSGRVSISFEDVQAYSAAVSGSESSSPEITQSVMLPSENSSSEVTVDSLPLETRPVVTIEPELEVADLSTSSRQVGAAGVEDNDHSLLLIAAGAAVIIAIYCYS